jgi:tetratricopeptide (TPR) repeat protein
LSELEIARASLPNDPLLFRLIGAIQRRQGKWQESVASYSKAVLLDPKDPIVLENMGWTFFAMRDYVRAAETFDRGIAVAPDSFILRQLRARVEFEGKGDLGPLPELLAKSPENVDPNGTVLLTRYNVGMYDRQSDALVETLQRSPASISRGETSAPIPRSFLLGNVYRLQGDAENARAAYEEARGILEDKVRESSDDAPRHALLGLIYGGLGRCEQAAAEADRALELLPESKDAFDGPILTVSRARIAAMCGDADRAIARLSRSLRTPAGVTLAELHFDPSWDPLRHDVRFAELLTAK